MALTPAGRIEQVMELLAPVVGVDEDGLPIRDESLGVISKEEALDLLDRADKIDRLIDGAELPGCPDREPLP